MFLRGVTSCLPNYMAPQICSTKFVCYLCSSEPLVARQTTGPCALQIVTTVFMPPDTQIVEVFPRGWSSNTVYRTATLMTEPYVNPCRFLRNIRNHSPNNTASQPCRQNPTATDSSKIMVLSTELHLVHFLNNADKEWEVSVILKCRGETAR